MFFKFINLWYYIFEIWFKFFFEFMKEWNYIDIVEVEIFVKGLISLFLLVVIINKIRFMINF